MKKHIHYLLCIGSFFSAIYPENTPFGNHTINPPPKNRHKISLLDDQVSLAKGMQISIRPDGKHHLFEFDQLKDDKYGLVKRNRQRYTQ